jgi:hypothetical protein
MEPIGRPWEYKKTRDPKSYRVSLCPIREPRSYRGYLGLIGETKFLKGKPRSYRGIIGHIR